MAGKRRANAGSFQKGTSGNPSGMPKRLDAQSRLDGWMNDLTGFGILGRDKTLGSSQNHVFASDVVTSEDAVEFWRGDDIAARYIELIPNEALRQGWEIVIGQAQQPDPFKPPTVAPQPTPPAKPGRLDADDDGDLQRVVSKQLRDLGLMAALREVMHYRRAYGGGAILLGANDFTVDLREPLDLSRVRSLDWLTPLEPRELIPRWYYNNPRAPKFGQPAIYQFVPFNVGQSVDGGNVPSYQEIHESRLIIFPGIRVSRRIMSTSTFSWGDSVLTRIIRALRDFNMAHTAAAILLNDFSQAVFKVKDLAELIAQDGPQALLQKMISIDTARSILRATVVDADGEDFERKSTPMSGFPETLDRLSLRLAAAAGWPVKKLMGNISNGLGDTGAGDDNTWDDMIRAVQTQEVEPAVTQVVKIILATLGENPDEIDHQVKFPPLSQPTELETAQAHFAQAQADAVYLTNDVVSPEEVALSRFGGATFSYDTKIDFTARSAQEAVTAPVVDAKPEPPPIIMAPMPTAAGQPHGAAIEAPE